MKSQTFWKFLYTKAEIHNLKHHYRYPLSGILAKVEVTHLLLIQH